MDISMNSHDLWVPRITAQTIRILPATDGDPFKTFYLHPTVGTETNVYCTRRNEGKECPICSFAKSLWDAASSDSHKNRARMLFARPKHASTIMIRGEESKGPLIWVFGEEEHERLLDIVLDPHYADITSPTTGTDLIIHTAEDEEKIIITPIGISSPLQQDDDTDYTPIIKHPPITKSLFVQRSIEELRELVHHDERMWNEQQEASKSQK